MREQWTAIAKMFGDATIGSIGIGFDRAKTSCGIAHISGILLMNSYDL